MPYRNMSPCPYCRDLGYLRQPLLKFDRAKGAIGEAIQPCCCTNSVIINKTFPLLATVGDPPPSEFLDISKRVTEKKENKLIIKNGLFYGDEKKFRYFVKSIMLFYWNYTKNFIVHDGLQMFQEYFTSDGDHVSYDLMKYELVVLMFQTTTNNKALDKFIFDSIKNRYRYNKPTWVYAANNEYLKAAKEYSDALETVICFFPQIDLNEENKFKYKGFYMSSLEDIQKEKRDKIKNVVMNKLSK